MYKKVVNVFSLILVLGLIDSAWADVNWTHGGGDRLWRNAANWQDSVTFTARVPGSADKAGIRQGGDGPIIDSSTTAVANTVVCGDWSSTGNTLEITGGSLTTGGWIIFGYGANDEGTLIVKGGTTTCNSHLDIGFKGAGHMTMTNGSVAVTGTFGISLDSDGLGTSSGDLQLDGGTITCGSFTMKSGGAMDIAGGTLIVNGDVRSTVNGYITNGWITGYGVSGAVSVDYNGTTPGKTTIVAAASEKASTPYPGNGAVNVSIFPVLSWTAVANAVSHNVYFGTDPTPDESEFKGNQTEETFAPGLLDLNTTYYWRIDEVTSDHPDTPLTGAVWSFTTQVTHVCGKIVSPWRSTTAIVKPGESFEVWFDADPGQTVHAVELHGPYNTVYASKSIVTGNWVYDQMSGNRYDTRITVTVPANAPADRYDLVLRTSSGEAVSYGGVKVVSGYKDNYYIMHISDGHLYQSGYDTDTLLARKSAMMEIANIMDAQIIIETGDNMYNVRNHPDREVNYFLGNAALGTKGMADASAATFLVPGDHDAYAANDWPQSTAQVNADFFNDYWGRQSSCFKYGNGRFMPFNNAWAVSTENANEHAYQINEAIAWLQGPGSGGNFFVTAGHCYDKMHEFVDDYQALDLVLAGDKHHVRTDNPWPFDTGSPEVAYIAGSIREHFEFNLYKVNNNAGTFTTPSGSTAVANVLYSGNQDTPSTWIPNLELSYAQPNEGVVSANSAVFVNRYSFPITGARVRFVMPKGAVYAVSAGVIEQQFDGDQYRIVDVNVDLNANRLTTVNILACLGLADLNGSGTVDIEDLSYMAGIWLTSDSNADIAQPADGIVDLRDFSILSQQWYP